ncbi:L,D-transpeptidase [Curtobacterium sp. MCBD17_032]|uniref:L,D-transpeptidase n=1 Tax=Curtobacterium sp. MCBD17_032 TaxID=2175659 RepID=UPI000DA9368D|nr:L,D-transpeptidase [Curtobacterium sp. MCBD17_032]PZE84171.1 hypothetical protein DEI91_09775 [Curtobacterium sp. MCBD17_032]
MTEPSSTPGPDAPATRTRRRWIVGAGALAVVVAAGTTAWALGGTGQEARPTPVAAPRSVPPTPTPSATPLPAVPERPSDSALAALPLAFHDAVIGGLLDGSQVDAENAWTTATPTAPLVPLYASPDADAAPVATLSSSVSTINTPTATAVWGRSAGQDGGMVLVSTPSRNRTPGDGGVATAPSATFAWARAADFTLTGVDRVVRVDNEASTIAIVRRDGSVQTSEPARLGTPQDPTPTDTKTYMEANYVDPQVPYTQGHPISLTGAHSATLAGYGGNAALTALHYYPDPNGSSHGCVRISAAMTEALAGLPIGTPIEFS